MSTQQNTLGDVPKGAGQWSAGTVVREIEGHFNKHNEPKDAAPIDHTGGVPGVDFKERAKEALTGHSSSTHDSSRQSGGIGSGSTGLGSSTTGRSGPDSGLGSGSGSNTRDSATLGGSGLGSGTTGTGLSSGVGPGTTGHHAGLESASRSAGDRGLDSSNTDSALGSATGSGNRSGLTGTGGPVDATSSRTGGGVSGGHGGVGSSLTPSSGGGMGTTASGLNEGHEKLTGDRSHNISGATATLSDNQRAGGATHGISERAEHDLNAAVDGRGATELGGAGATSGATGGHHTARGGIQKELSETVGRGGAGTGTTGTESGGLRGPAAVAAAENKTGDTAGRTSLGEHQGHHTGDHNTSSTSGTSSPGKQKEGLLAKVKHALQK